MFAAFDLVNANKTPLTFTRTPNMLRVPGSTRVDPAFALDKFLY